MAMDDFGNEVLPVPLTVADQLKVHTDLITTIRASQFRLEQRTEGIVVMYEAMQGGMKVLGTLGKLGTWVGAIVGAGVTLWQLFKLFRDQTPLVK